jgi:type 1 fimbriae regulatory protein FimB
LIVEALSKDELHGLLTAAKARSERDWLMILVAFSHGLRATEVVSLTTDNVADGFIDVKRLKGSMRTKQALIEHPDPVLNERQALIDYVLKTPAGARLFKITRQRFWQIIQEHGTTAGLPKHKRFPHILKHSIAMQSIHSAGIENVRQYLGHKSLSSTGAYLRVNDSVASAAVASALLD